MFPYGPALFGADERFRDSIPVLFLTHTNEHREYHMRWRRLASTLPRLILDHLAKYNALLRDVSGSSWILARYATKHVFLTLRL